MKKSAWEAVTRSVAESPYPVTVLEPSSAGPSLVAALGIDVDSWLGAVVLHTGGLVVDGRLRVFGSGSAGLPAVHVEGGRTVVAEHVRGDRYALAVTGKGRLAVHQLDRGLSEWESLNLGYRNWLGAMIAGSLDEC
ncbi:DUF2625 family protein [Lentzea sp. JNUCC 0626]|uniref:DUF2625 family protein n=1 Tax=Lentzea sp. JNUCC 0626 TaxID=3367513 RepID=UPI00374871E1